MKCVNFVFPGQGAQRRGMAQDFCALYSECQKIFDTASEVLDINIQELCTAEDAGLNLTEYTQPAILTAEIAMFGVVRSQRAGTAYYAGHSLGEYAAIVAAGVLPFEEALRLVRLRGSLMQGAVPVGSGTMAALIGGEVATTALQAVVLNAGAEIANYNSPQQIVISGLCDAVELARADIARMFPGVRVVPLNVSAPFHSSHMRKIQEEFRRYLLELQGMMKLEKASLVLSNFTGGFHSAETFIENLVQQIAAPVRWERNMETLRSLEGEIIEIGPSRVLGRFLSESNLQSRAVTDMRSMSRNILQVSA